MNISRNQLQDLHLLPRHFRHGLFGDPEHVAEQVAGLASARLLRHSLSGDPKHVVEQVAELASARL